MGSLPASGGPKVALAALGVALAVGARLAVLVLSAQAMAALVAQVVLVEWGTARAGVVWSAVPATTTAILRRALPAAAIGLGLAATIVLLGAVTDGVDLERVPSVSVSLLALGLVNAVLVAWRDELLLHGLAIRALGDASHPLARVLACAATSAAAAVGKGDTSPRAVVVAALLGAILGALWVRDRGAWQPFAAHVAFRFAAGPLLAGGIVQMRVAATAWGGADAGLLGGTVAVVALLPFASAAVVLAGTKSFAGGEVR